MATKLKTTTKPTMMRKRASRHDGLDFAAIAGDMARGRARGAGRGGAEAEMPAPGLSRRAADLTDILNADWA